jgi:hypothetical protein
MSTQYIQEALSYDPENGLLTWKMRPREHFKTDKGHRIWRTRYAGAIAGAPTTKGYLKLSLCGIGLKAHRVAWEIFHGEPPRGQIDHINGNPADNRIANLRVVTNGTNARNRSLSSNNVSGFHGVHWREDLGRWSASIGVGDEKKKSLGFYDTKEEAVAARRGAEVVLDYHENHGREKAVGGRQ